MWPSAVGNLENIFMFWGILTETISGALGEQLARGTQQFVAESHQYFRKNTDNIKSRIIITHVRGSNSTEARRSSIELAG